MEDEHTTIALAPDRRHYDFATNAGRPMRQNASTRGAQSGAPDREGYRVSNPSLVCDGSWISSGQTIPATRGRTDPFALAKHRLRYWYLAGQRTPNPACSFKGID